MIKTQMLPIVNVEAHTPLITNFYTRNAPCQFCTCGKTGSDVCVNTSASRALTIIERETDSGHRYTIGTASAHNGHDFKPLRGHSNYTMPCAALAGAAKMSYTLSLPVLFKPTAGADWNAINAEVSARLYQRGFDAFDESVDPEAGPGFDQARDGWCQVEQRIYAGPVVATRTINIHPARILDNEVTRQGWAAAAALDEAGDMLSRPNFSYDTDVDGMPVAEEATIRIAQIAGCVITLYKVDGGFQVERFLMTPDRTDTMVSLDSALLVFDVMVEEEEEVLRDMAAEAEAHLPSVIIADTIALDEIPF